MNRVTITKYSDMKQIAGNVARTMIDLNEKCKWHWSSNTLVMELQIPGCGFELCPSTSHLYLFPHCPS